MSTLQVGQPSYCEMGGRTRGLLAKAVTKAMDFFLEENMHVDFGHPQGRVLVPSHSCTVVSPNTAFGLEKVVITKACLSQVVMY